jgi:hypothetical protein
MSLAESHPWADKRGVLALMYKNSETAYRIEVWNPIQDKKISAMTMEMPKSERNPSMRISPHSKYLVVMTSDGKSIQSYDINTGKLIQNIELKTPRPLSNWVDEGVFFDDDAIFFIRHSNFVEAYSIESGQFLQKISGLNLLQGNSCATFCLEDPNNFTYFSRTKTFVVYNNASNRNNIDLSFTSYDIETAQKIGTTSIQLPYQLQNGEKVDKGKLSLSIDYIYLPSEENGNIAVVKVNLHDWDTTLHDSTIYVVDVSANKVLKSYTWQHTSWASKSLAFKNFFFFDGRPEPVSFLFDISTP